MTLNDRFTKGLIAGLAAGLVTVGWDLFSFHVINFSKHTFLDFPASIIYGFRPKTLPERLFAVTAVFVWIAVTGILFAFLIKYVNSKNMILKGLIWGLAVWFFTYMVVLLFEINGFQSLPVISALSHFIGATIWGIFLGLFYNFLEEKVI
ncbi:MAG: hypothetical protein ACYC2T_15630 [Bacillota bacterium]